MNLNPAQMMNRTMGSLGIKLNLQTRDRIYGFLLTLPALLVVFSLIFYPLGLGIINSFREVNLFLLIHFLRLPFGPQVSAKNAN